MGKECYAMRKRGVKKKDCLLNLGVVTQNVEQTELKEKHEYILQSAKRCIQGE